MTVYHIVSEHYSYGFVPDTCNLFKVTYVRGTNVVKLGTSRSNWALTKRVPRGSVLGPLLFNVFLNDLLFSLDGLCNIYNYADDNTISVSTEVLSVMKNRLKDASDIEWFKDNHM